MTETRHSGSSITTLGFYGRKQIEILIFRFRDRKLEGKATFCVERFRTRRLRVVGFCRPADSLHCFIIVTDR